MGDWENRPKLGLRGVIEKLEGDNIVDRVLNLYEEIYSTNRISSVISELVPSEALFFSRFYNEKIRKAEESKEAETYQRYLSYFDIISLKWFLEERSQPFTEFRELIEKLVSVQIPQRTPGAAWFALYVDPELAVKKERPRE